MLASSNSLSGLKSSQSGSRALDTTYRFETPEGVILELKSAGLVVRSIAWLIDFLIRIVIYMVLGVTVGSLGNFGTGMFLIALFLIEWFYPVFFELRTGSTPGKKQYGLMVVHDDGTPVTWQASVTRNLLRAADFLPFMYGAGILCMLANKDFKRLGDIAAGTLVVYRSEEASFELEQTAPPIPLPNPVNMPAQRAILSFAERQSGFSEERRAELAQTLTPFITSAKTMHSRSRPYTTSNSQNHSVSMVLGYASWIMSGGKRQQDERSPFSMGADDAFIDLDTKPKLNKDGSIDFDVGFDAGTGGDNAVDAAQNNTKENNTHKSRWAP